MGILNCQRRNAEPAFEVDQDALQARLAGRLQSLKDGKASCFASKTSNKREAPRENSLRVGAAYFSPESETTCRVIDTSFGGLKLEFLNGEVAPEEFALTVPTLRFIGIVKSEWQKDGVVGVSIVRWRETD